MMGRWVSRGWVALLLVLAGSACYGSAFVIPQNTWGEGSNPLPARRIEVRGSIERQVCRLTNTYTFVNRSSTQFEGVFKTKLRPGAAVLDFAYWFHGIRVPAKILEKGQAREIYERITRGLNRDPALLERKGDWYEATIFPIEPNSELRVEIEYAWLLPAQFGTALFDYPLQAYLGPEPIGELDVDIALDPATRFALGPDTLYAPTVENHHARLKWTDLQPKRNLVFKLAPNSPSATAFVAARSEEPAGYFLFHTLAVTQWRRPTFDLEHGSLSHLVIDSPLPVGRGQRLAVWGRYTGGGRDTLIVRDGGRSWRFPLTLPTEATSDGEWRPLVARLWARRYVAKLASDPDHPRPKYRDVIIQLSKQFHIDSPFTAFLAVPDSEWSEYVRALEDDQRWLRSLADAELDAVRMARVIPRWLVAADPLIKVKAPPGATDVTAILPDGDIVPLRYDTAGDCWLGRFEIPPGTPDGSYQVTVLIRFEDGRRQELSLGYEVDLTAPLASPAGDLVGRPGARVAVSLAGEQEIAKVILVGPWDERFELRREATSGRFGGELVVPADAAPGVYPVRLLVFDRVHNRTEVTCDLEVR